MTINLIPGGGLTIPVYPRFGLGSAPSISTSLLNDATGEKVAFIGQVWNKDRTTKSITKIGFRFGSVVKAGGSGLTVSLQNVDTTTGPVGRPDETQDQTVAIANGNASFASNTWCQTNALSTNRSVAYGEMIAVVWEFDGSGRLGADSYVISGMSGSEGHLPLSLTKLGGSWDWNAVSPNIIFEFTDGTFGTLRGAWPFSAVNSLSFASNTTPDEYAMEFQLPAPCKVDGGWFAGFLISAGTGDFDIVLYNGTTVLATKSYDANFVEQVNSQKLFEFCFSSEVELAANTTYRLAVKPTTTAGVDVAYFDVSAAGHLQAHGFGEFGTTSRTDSGAWAAPTTTRRLLAGLHVSSIDDGTGGGNTIIVNKIINNFIVNEGDI